MQEGSHRLEERPCAETEEDGIEAGLTEEERPLKGKRPNVSRQARAVDAKTPQVAGESYPKATKPSNERKEWDNLLN